MADWKETAFKLGTAVIAGSLATFAMNRVTSLLESTRPEVPPVNHAFHDRKDPQRVLVDRLNKRFQWKMRRKDRRKAARRLRFGLGLSTTVGGIFLRKKLGATTHPLRGAAFDTLLFVLVDEVIKPLLGARKSPRHVPWQTHAAALAGRATYGVVNAGVRQGVYRAVPAQLSPR